MAPVIDRFFRDPDTGRLAVVQAPNLPLVVFLVATAVRLGLRPEGAAGWATAAVATVALTWWAADEVARGDSPFRRVLGAVVLGTILVGLLDR
jgi:hypothetical protein